MNLLKNSWPIGPPIASTPSVTNFPLSSFISTMSPPCLISASLPLCFTIFTWLPPPMSPPVLSLPHLGATSHHHLVISSPHHLVTSSPCHLVLTLSSPCLCLVLSLPHLIPISPHLHLISSLFPPLQVPFLDTVFVLLWSPLSPNSYLDPHVPPVFFLSSLSSFS